MSDDKIISVWLFKCVTANLALFQSEVLKRLILMQPSVQTYSLTDTSVIISSLKLNVLYLGIGMWGVKFATRLSLGLHLLHYWSLGCRFVFVICAPWTSNMTFQFFRIDNVGDSYSYGNMQRKCLHFLTLCSDSTQKCRIKKKPHRAPFNKHSVSWKACLPLLI